MAKPKSASFSLCRVSSSNRFSAVCVREGKGVRRGSGVEGEACGRRGEGERRVGGGEGMGGESEMRAESERRGWNGMGGDWDERRLEGDGVEGEGSGGE